LPPPSPEEQLEQQQHPEEQPNERQSMYEMAGFRPDVFTEVPF
jgi:hypothetical protein